MHDLPWMNSATVIPTASAPEARSSTMRRTCAVASPPRSAQTQHDLVAVNGVDVEVDRQTGAAGGGDPVQQWVCRLAQVVRAERADTPPRSGSPPPNRTARLAGASNADPPSHLPRCQATWCQPSSRRCVEQSHPLRDSAPDHERPTMLARPRHGQPTTTTGTSCTRLLANPPRFHGCSTGWLRPLSSCARAESR